MSKLQGAPYLLQALFVFLKAVFVLLQVDYVPKLTWNKVGRHFLKKTKEFQMKAAEEKEKLHKEVMEEVKMVEKRYYDKQLGRIVSVRTLPDKRVWNENVEHEFFDRLSTKLTERDKKIKELSQKLEGETCTFKPIIASHRNRDKLDSDDDDDEATGKAIFQRFIHRVDEDIAERRIKNPERFGTKRVYETSKFKV